MTRRLRGAALLVCAALAAALRKAAAEGPPAPPEHLKKVVRERYDWGVITARYLSVYEQAIQTQNTPPT